jgi:hypothetical protein
MKKYTFMLTLLVAVLALIGCTAVTDTGSGSENGPEATPTGAELQVTRARQHLAASLNVDLSGVTLVEATAVEWSDSSLGCPEPDMMYLTVITPGYHIILEANGERYEYHADENETVVLCPADRSLLKDGEQGEREPSAEIPAGAVDLAAQVRQDLAAQLDIQLDKVIVLEATAVEWRDSSLGCPEPDTMYLTVITPGYHIVLEANGEKYSYHTDENDRFVLCPADRSLLETGDTDNMDGSFARGSEAMIAEVKQDLANQLAIELNDITVVEATAVEWSDSSLGCPEPDMMYLTVITPGYRIILEADGEKYHYHTNQEGYFVLCPADRSEAGGAVEQ